MRILALITEARQVRKILLQSTARAGPRLLKLILPSATGQESLRLRLPFDLAL
jgi:hypothetical protein